MAVGLYTVVLYCLLTALPHFLYGAGSDALSLTVEYRTSVNANLTLDVLERERRKTLCHERNVTKQECEMESTNYTPQVILFVAQLISGIGGSLYYTLGVSYMDDNIKKSKTPALISKYNAQRHRLTNFPRFFLHAPNVGTGDRLRIGVVLPEALHFANSYPDNH